MSYNPFDFYQGADGSRRPSYVPNYDGYNYGGYDYNLGPFLDLNRIQREREAAVARQAAARRAAAEEAAYIEYLQRQEAFRQLQQQEQRRAEQGPNQQRGGDPRRSREQLAQEKARRQQERQEKLREEELRREQDRQLQARVREAQQKKIRELKERRLRQYNEDLFRQRRQEEADRERLRALFQRHDPELADTFESIVDYLSRAIFSGRDSHQAEALAQAEIENSARAQAEAEFAAEANGFRSAEKVRSDAQKAQQRAQNASNSEGDSAPTRFEIIGYNSHGEPVIVPIGGWANFQDEDDNDEDDKDEDENEDEDEEDVEFVGLDNYNGPHVPPLVEEPASPGPDLAVEYNDQGPTVATDDEDNTEIRYRELVRKLDEAIKRRNEADKNAQVPRAFQVNSIAGTSASAAATGSGAAAMATAGNAEGPLSEEELKSAQIKLDRFDKTYSEISETFDRIRKESHASYKEVKSQIKVIESAYLKAESLYMELDTHRVTKQLRKNKHDLTTRAVSLADSLEAYLADLRAICEKLKTEQGIESGVSSVASPVLSASNSHKPYHVVLEDVTDEVAEA